MAVCAVSTTCTLGTKRWATWLDRLNGRLIASSNEGGFAGYSDWRLPTLAELRTIVTIGSSPTIDPIFGQTAASAYFSASTAANDPGIAWLVLFSDGDVNGTFKDQHRYVRAVRGGPGGP